MAEQKKNGTFYKVVSTIGGVIVIGVFVWAIVNDYFSKATQIDMNRKAILELKETRLSVDILKHNMERLMQSQGLTWEIPFELQVKLRTLSKQ